jgi:hypothetical protein
VRAQLFTPESPMRRLLADSRVPEKPTTHCVLYNLQCAVPLTWRHFNFFIKMGPRKAGSASLLGFSASLISFRYLLLSSLQPSTQQISSTGKLASSTPEQPAIFSLQQNVFLLERMTDKSRPGYEITGFVTSFHVFKKVPPGIFSI